MSSPQLASARPYIPSAIRYLAFPAFKCLEQDGFRPNGETPTLATLYVTFAARCFAIWRARPARAIALHDELAGDLPNDRQLPIAACCTNGKPHNIINQTSRRLS